MEINRIVEGKNHGGLDDWFKKEKWVDVSRPKKKGKGYEPCGRGDTSKGKKPVCTPANKAKNLTEKQRKNRIRQKRRKEKDPNPDKKPNVTKYTEQAGGKSNVSNTTRFRIVTSNESPRFVKVALMGEEDEERTTDLSNFFNEKDQMIEDMSKMIVDFSMSSVADKMSAGLTGPGMASDSENTSLPKILNTLPDANQDEMSERDYLRYIRFAVNARRKLYDTATKARDSKLQEIAYIMNQKGVNPFNFGQVSGVVREVLDKRVK